jgi:amino acid permease
MGSAIIELISSIVNISGNPIVDTILFAVIGVISFSIAFGIVGAIFDTIGLYDSEIMSGVHWTIRVIIFVGLTWLLVKIFQFIAWLISFPWWVYCVFVIVIAVTIFAIYYLKYTIRKKHNKQNMMNPKDDVDEKPTLHETDIPLTVRSNIHFEYNKDRCPRCGSKLLRRHGPYGDFIGCSSYPKCNYTRSKL